MKHPKVAIADLLCIKNIATFSGDLLSLSFRQKWLQKDVKLIGSKNWLMDISRDVFCIQYIVWLYSDPNLKILLKNYEEPFFTIIAIIEILLP